MDVAVEGRMRAVDTVAFPLLKLVVEARNEHGMRQQDWTRYRRYCAVKTQRLRSTLHLTHAVEMPKPHSRKRRATPAAQSDANKGRGHEFVRREIALDAVVDSRCVKGERALLTQTA
jgi:hypothetical protein